MRLLLLLTITTLVTGCMIKGTYNGEIKDPLETNIINDSDEFRYNMITLLNSEERNKLYAQFTHSKYNSKRIAKGRQNDGASVAITEAAGGSGLGNASVGLSLVANTASWLVERSSGDNFVHGYNINQSTIDEAKKSDKPLEQYLFDKTINAIHKTAKIFNYDIKCIDRCVNHKNPTFELKSNKSNKLSYKPERMIVATKLNTDSIINTSTEEVSANVFGKVYPKKVLINDWRISFQNVLDLDENNNVMLREVPNQDRVVSQRGRDMSATEIGRNMYTFLSNELDGWYFGSKILYGEVSFYKGKLYALKGLRDHKRLRGIEATN